MYLYTSQPPRDSKALRPESPRDDFLGGPSLDPRSKSHDGRADRSDRSDQSLIRDLILKFCCATT
jgi:hypothetical protein